MRQRNNKVIVKRKLLGTRKLGIFSNDYIEPILNNVILKQEYFQSI